MIFLSSYKIQITIKDILVGRIENIYIFHYVYLVEKIKMWKDKEKITIMKMWKGEEKNYFKSSF